MTKPRKSSAGNARRAAPQASAIKGLRKPSRALGKALDVLDDTVVGGGIRPQRAERDGTG